jgi:hypothetical protein
MRTPRILKRTVVRFLILGRVGGGSFVGLSQQGQALSVPQFKRITITFK